MTAKILLWPHHLSIRARERIKEHKLKAVEWNFRLLRNPYDDDWRHTHGA